MQLSSGYKREGRLNVSDERPLHCRMVNFTCVLYRPIASMVFLVLQLASHCIL